jgi:hypothetical protein
VIALALHPDLSYEHPTVFLPKVAEIIIKINYIMGNAYFKSKYPV